MKVVTVATAAQKAMMESILIPEMSHGFWGKNKSDTVELWSNVEVKLGTELGLVGFKPTRNYNFLNAEFMEQFSDSLISIARSVDPEMTSKQLRKQLILLNQIVGLRVSPVGGEPTKLNRGNSRKKKVTESLSYMVAGNSVHRMPATFCEEAL